MFTLNLLSESTHEPNLTWLLWLVLIIFAIVVIVGWMVSNKKGDEVAHKTHTEDENHASAAKTNLETEMPARMEEIHIEEAPISEEEIASQTRDNLKKLEGIGPKVESILNGIGIATFAQLAGADVEKLREVLVAARLQMMEPSGWIEQAVFAAKGDWDGLQKLQDELKGGRHV